MWLAGIEFHRRIDEVADDVRLRRRNNEAMLDKMAEKLGIPKSGGAFGL